MKTKLLILAKKYQVFFIVFSLLCAGIILTNILLYFTYSTFDCGTSPYSPFKDKYCNQMGTVDYGQTDMKSYDVLLQPSIILETKFLKLVGIFDDIEIWNVEWPTISNPWTVLFPSADVQINTFIAKPTLLKDFVIIFLKIISTIAFVCVLTFLARYKKWLKYLVYFFLTYLLVSRLIGIGWIFIVY